jgi:hypothetical protein
MDVVTHTGVRLEQKKTFPHSRYGTINSKIFLCLLMLRLVLFSPVKIFFGAMGYFLTDCYLGSLIIYDPRTFWLYAINTIMRVSSQ